MKRLITVCALTFIDTVLIVAPAGAASQSMPNRVYVEPGAGAWRTWVLASGSELRPAAPPDQSATRAELDQLHALDAERDAAAFDRVSYWDTGDPSYRWNEMAMSRFTQITAPPNQRGMALLSVAVYDATIATWDVNCWSKSA